MERKDNDLMLNIVANPNFTIADFATIGFNINNTSLQDKSVYKNNELIQKTFTDEKNGKFNEKLFNDVYESSLLTYNYMASEQYKKEAKKQISYHRDDIFASDDQKRKGPDFKQVIVPNPDRVTSSIIQLGKQGERKKSRDELAQTQKVLLNPSEVADGDWSKAKWGDSPNDNFWGYFTDTLVMAQWDQDGTHVDPLTGQKVQHHKGELKTNADGTYYYEKLDGRDVYGKRVLNKLNVITTDGSFANKYDILDSDDIEQNPGATVLKNLALVGTMFVPYVGPVISGLSIATQLAGLTGTLGRMLAGSDSPFFSELEGWGKSVNRQTARSEYAQENTWCWENFINLIGDVAGQLKEQRFIFEKIPAIIKGGYAGSNTAYAKKLKQLEDEYTKIANSKTSELKRIYGQSDSKVIKAAQELQIAPTLQAQAEMDSWIKGYNKIGEILSKGYMTAITVGDTYGEAKAAGASDLDATLLTLGYAAGEYAILNTGIGEWIFPELRAQKYKYKALKNALTGEIKQTTEELRKEFGSTIAALPKEGKMKWAKKLFNIGKDIATAEYSTGSRAGKDLIKASFAGGLGEGIEEISEEFLADFSKGCYNTVNWLRGNDTRMNSFGFEWKDGQRSWNGQSIFDRYGMSLIGGFVGGGLTNLGTSYRTVNTSYTPESAAQQIVYMARNGELSKFRDYINKNDIANKKLSTNFELVNGKPVLKPGTESDNQDLNAKIVINRYLDFVESALEAEGSTLSDDSFLNGVLGELRYNQLYNSKTASDMLQYYNTLNTEILKDVINIKNLSIDAKDSNKDGKVDDKENKQSTTKDANLKKAQEKLKENKKKLQELLDGKLNEKYINRFLFEVTPALHQHLLAITLPMYAKNKFGRDFKDLSEVEKQQATTEFQQWEQFDYKDKIRNAADVFLDYVRESSNVITNQGNFYRNQSKTLKDITSRLTNIYKNLGFDLNLDAVTAQDVTVGLNSASIKNGIAKSINPDQYNSYNQLFEQRKQEIENNQQLNQAEKTLELTRINNEFQSQVEDLVNKEVSNIAQRFVDQGFINFDTKQKILPILQALQTNLVSKQGMWIQDLIDEETGEVLPEGEGIIDPNTFDLIEGKVTPFTRDINNLNTLIKNFQNLSNTPFEQNLDQFAQSLGEEPIKFSDIIASADSVLNTFKDDFSALDLSADLSSQIDNAIRVIQFYQAAINAAKTDNAGLDNAWGHNRTLNEIAQSLGTESNLAEIDSEYANLLLEDLENSKSKLMLIKAIYNHNQGNKLLQQDHVTNNTYRLIYNKLKTIVQVPDDENKEIEQWDSFRKFRDIINDSNKFKVLSKISAGKVIALSPDEKKQLIAEIVILDDAIYEFFQDPRLQNESELIKFVNPKRFDIYQKDDNEILNKGTEHLQDSTFLWYVASRAALKSSDFMKQYKEIIDIESGIAPITPQELAIFNNYASIINGNVISNIFSIYSKSIELDWDSQTIDERRESLRKLGKGESDINEFSKDEWADKCKLFLPVPKYSNISLTEGIAGSGKTTAVINGTISLLKKFRPELIANVKVVHGADETGKPEQAKKILDNLHVNGKPLDKVTFLKELSPDYKESDAITESDYKLQNGEIHSTWKITGNTQNIPSLILIDEIGKFNALELDLINRYAQEKGITVLVAGDFDQTKNRVKIKIDENVTYDATSNKSDFISNYKLGVSMRTDNSLKTWNNNTYQYYKNHREGIKQLQKLKYYEDETGQIWGDKVFDISQNQDDTINKTVKQVKKLINSLEPDEKIMYIHQPGSKLDKALDVVGIKEHITTISEEKAQGREARFYIVESTFAAGKTKEEMDSIHDIVYTGVTRAQQGSILVIDSQSLRIGSQKVDNYVEEGEQLKSLIPKYAAAKKKMLEELFPDSVEIQYNERFKINNIEEVIPEQDTDIEFVPPVLEQGSSQEEDSTEDGYKTITHEQLRAKYGNNMDLSNFTININGKDIPVSFEMFTEQQSRLCEGKENVEKFVSPIINYAAFEPINDIQRALVYRPIVLIRIGNFLQPFYMSSGNEGETYRNADGNIVPLPTNVWYPFFGIQYQKGALNNGWINKINGDKMYEYYSSPVLKAICEYLNGTISIPKSDTVIPTPATAPRYVHASGEPNKKIIGPNTLAPEVWVEEANEAWINKVNTNYQAVNFNDPNIISKVTSNIQQGISQINQEVERLSNQSITPPSSPTSIEEILEIFQASQEIVPAVDVSSDEKYKKTLNNKNDTHSPDSKVIDGETIKINQLFHSFNMLELGMLVDDNGNVVDDIQTNRDGSQINVSELRIDGANGLRKIEKLIVSDPNISPKNKKHYALPPKNNNKDWYLDKIAFLQNLILTNPDRNSILESIKSYLGYNAEFINFAIKASPIISEQTLNSNKDYVANDIANFGKYGFNKKEKSLYNPSSDTRSDDIIPHKIVALIGNQKDGEILEIPLLSLSNPVTLMRAINENDTQLFGEIANFWDKNANISFHQKVQDVIYKFENSTKYKELIDLFKLFAFNHSGLFRINDINNPNDQFANWLPAKDLENLGLIFSTKKGRYQTQEGMSFDSREHWGTISKFANNPRFTVSSKVLVSPKGLVSIDGKSQKLIQPGHSFVFIGTSDLKSDDDLINYFKKQNTDGTPESLHPKVEVVYVKPPTASIEEYIDSITRKLNGDKSEVRNIGNLYTPFKILQILLANSDIQNLIRKNYFNSKEDNLANLQNIIQQLSELYISKQYSELNRRLMEYENWDGQKKPLISYLSNILTLLAYNPSRLSASERVNGKFPASMDQNVLNLMRNILDKAKFTIYYRGNKIQQSSKNIGGFIAVEYQENYSINGKPFTINGKIDTPTFRGDFSNIIDKALHRIYPVIGKDGQPILDNNLEIIYRSKDYYLNGKSTVAQEVKPSRIVKKAISNLDKVQTLIDINPIKLKYNLDNLEQANKLTSVDRVNQDIIESIIKTSNRLALIIGEEILYSDNIFEESPIVQNTNTLNNIDVFKQQDGSYDFIIESKGIQYRCILNGEQVEYSEISQPQSTTQAINIDNNLFVNYKDLAIKLVQNFGMSGKPFKTLLNFNTFEDFSNSLLNKKINEKVLEKMQQIVNQVKDKKESQLLQHIIDILKVPIEQRSLNNDNINGCKFNKYLRLL